MSSVPSTYRTTRLREGVVSFGAHPFPHEALADDAVVIRPHHMGICRADVKEILGSRDVPEDRGPLFGHELVGSVFFAGSASGFTEGETVTLNPNITPARTTGFAEYVFVRGTKEQLEQAVVRVPGPDPRQDVWMPEPFACIVHAVRKLLEPARLDSLAGKRVGIVGAGCAGLMFAMYARHLGASVTVFNRGEARRAFAREQGILTADEIRPLAEAGAHPDAFDVVVVAPTVATAELLETAAGMAADGAVVLVYGGTRKGDRFPGTSVDVDAVRRGELVEWVERAGKRLGVSGAYGCFKEDYEEGFRLRAEHPADFPLDRMASRRITLDELPEFVMDIAAGRTDHPGKVLIEAAPQG
ncbi:alcohol dehydrogenase catalytic domain-containing protein [Streptomyces sp. NPDC012637]|uniref:alcohol dehydrogenase catalytic domain-containing protein n=1 Tax=Streptomyces sp. NPDC012637 TaxID=3364842 RepID=UPI0036EE640C